MGDKKETNKKEKKKFLIKPEDILMAEAGSYKAVDVLCTRGFNEVYKVSSTRKPELKYALKAELHKAPGRPQTMLRLKVETHLFSEIAKVKNENGFVKAKKIDTSHFINMIDKGSTPLFKYYVMDLTWLPLSDVVSDVLNYKLSAHAKINIARQSLASIEALHEMNYLHRNIKPSTFSIGLPPNDTVLYLMNFGTAKGYRDNNGNVKLPRNRVRIVGEPKYASLAHLEKKELSRRDDVEGWLYMMIELYERKNILWRYARPDQLANVILVKKRLFDEPLQLRDMGKLLIPNGYYRIITLIGAMTYYDAVNFKLINDHLCRVIAEDKADMSQKLDWIGMKVPEKEKPKKEENGQKKIVKTDNNKKQPSNEGDDKEEKNTVSDFDRQASEYEDFLQWRKEKKEKKAGGRGKVHERKKEEETKTAADRTMVDKTVDVTIDEGDKQKKEKKGEAGRKADEKPKTLKLGYAETLLAKKKGKDDQLSKYSEMLKNAECKIEELEKNESKLKEEWLKYKGHIQLSVAHMPPSFNQQQMMSATSSAPNGMPPQYYNEQMQQQQLQQQYPHHLQQQQRLVLPSTVTPWGPPLGVVLRPQHGTIFIAFSNGLVGPDHPAHAQLYAQYQQYTQQKMQHQIRMEQEKTAQGWNAALSSSHIPINSAEPMMMNDHARDAMDKQHQLHQLQLQIQQQPTLPTTVAPIGPAFGAKYQPQDGTLLIEFCNGFVGPDHPAYSQCVAQYQHAMLADQQLETMSAATAHEEKAVPEGWSAPSFTKINQEGASRDAESPAFVNQFARLSPSFEETNYSSSEDDFSEDSDEHDQEELLADEGDVKEVELEAEDEEEYYDNDTAFADREEEPLVDVKAQPLESVRLAQQTVDILQDSNNQGLKITKKVLESKNLPFWEKMAAFSIRMERLGEKMKDLDTRVLGIEEGVEVSKGRVDSIDKMIENVEERVIEHIL